MADIYDLNGKKIEVPSMGRDAEAEEKLSVLASCIETVEEDLLDMIEDYVLCLSFKDGSHMTLNTAGHMKALLGLIEMSKLDVLYSNEDFDEYEE